MTESNPWYENRGGSIYVRKAPQDVELGQAVRIIGESGDIIGQGVFQFIENNAMYIGNNDIDESWPLSAFHGNGPYILEAKVPLSGGTPITAPTDTEFSTGGQVVEGATTGITESDAINHPLHYNQDPSGVECIQIVRHRTYNIGNAIKYLWRAGLKDEDTKIEDLEKAVWSIRDEIDRLKGGV